MNTWISSPFAALTTAITLSACALTTPSVPNDAELAPPLTSARMMHGVSATAPQGYCFDRDSLSPEFALLARCDTLGMRGSDGEVPLAVITLTLAEFAEESALSAEALVSAEEDLISAENRAPLQLAKIAGSPPQEGLSEQFWRGAGLIKGDVLMGLALYQSDLQDDMGPAAPDLLEEAFLRSGGTVPTETDRTGPRWLAGLLGRERRTNAKSN